MKGQPVYDMNTHWEQDSNEVGQLRRCLGQKYDETELAKLPDKVLEGALKKAQAARKKALARGHSIHVFGRATEILRREHPASCRSDG